MRKQARESGYQFEYRMMKRYIKHGWNAWRLGESSAGLPDILALNDTHMNIHELKFTHTKKARIPAHQIARCLDLASAFKRYECRVVLTARFADDAVEYHYIWDGAKKDLKNVYVWMDGRVSGCDAKALSWQELLRVCGGGA